MDAYIILPVLVFSLSTLLVRINASQRLEEFTGMTRPSELFGDLLVWAWCGSALVLLIYLTF